MEFPCLGQVVGLREGSKDPLGQGGGQGGDPVREEARTQGQGALLVLTHRHLLLFELLDVGMDTTGRVPIPLHMDEDRGREAGGQEIGVCGHDLDAQAREVEPLGQNWEEGPTRGGPQGK